jgi:hypothetical protein
VKKGIDVGEGNHKGKGVLGNIIKTVGNAAADFIPMPRVLRDVGKECTY